MNTDELDWKWKGQVLFLLQRMAYSQGLLTKNENDVTMEITRSAFMASHKASLAGTIAYDSPPPPDNLEVNQTDLTDRQV